MGNIKKKDLEVKVKLLNLKITGLKLKVSKAVDLMDTDPDKARFILQMLLNDNQDIYKNSRDTYGK